MKVDRDLPHSFLGEEHLLKEMTAQVEKIRPAISLLEREEEFAS